MATNYKPVHVSAEWGELKETVYGWPEQFIFGEFLQDAELRPVNEFRRLWKESPGQFCKEIAPEIFERHAAQVNGVVKFLVDSGVRVRQPKIISDANLKFPRGQNHGCFTSWTRDSFVTIGNNVIELAPRTLFHRRARFAVRHILQETMDRGARYFAQPDCGADDSVEEPGWGYLEGGDVFVLGKKILVGNSGHCSNPEGARWLQHMLGDEYDVESVDLDGTMFQHLDCVLCTPREGVVIACSKAYLNGLPEHLKDWDLIEVDEKYCNDALGCNHMVLNNSTVIVPSEDEHDHVAKALTQRNFEVVRLPYADVYQFGGSFRCAHQPLIRE